MSDEEARRILDEWESIPARAAGELHAVAAYARRLERRVAERDARIAAAREHIEQAKLWTDSGDECAVHLRRAEMALGGEAGA